MSRQVSDLVLDAAIRAVLAARAMDTAGMPSAAEVRVRVLTRHPQRIATGWRLMPAWQLVVVLALLALTAAIVLTAASLQDPPRPSDATNGRIVVSANPLTASGGENGDIYVLDDGAAQIERFEPLLIIGSDGDGLAQACPRFSPDGQMLAYAEAKASGIVTTFRDDWPVPERAVIAVVVDESGRPTGRPIRFDIAQSAGALACPEWSPDSTRIAILIDAELRVIEVASGVITPFPTAVVPGGQGDFEWSRDGSRIAIAEPGGIRIVAVGGASNVIPVEGAVPAFLGWTSDDVNVTYGVTDEPGDARQLRMVASGGADDVALTSIPAAPGVTRAVNAAVIAPNGQQVAIASVTFRCDGDGCSSEPSPLVVLDVGTGTEVEVAVPDEFLVSGILWSPDSTRLLLSSIQGVLSVGLTVGEPVTYHSAGELNLEWSPTEISWQPLFP